MRLQLSPWQAVATSMPLTASSSKQSRRRKRSGSNGEIPPEKDGFPPFAASFVASTKRYRQTKKKRGQYDASLAKDETVPSIAVTAAHQVSVLGRILTSSRLDDDKHPTLRECSQWEYSSRPDKSASFFQEPLRNGVSEFRLPNIPATLDARNDRVYALQNGNSALCCWHADDANGPDDLDAPAVRVVLRKPAVSLEVLPHRKGIICGTCVDGSLFVGKWEQDTLHLEYTRGIQSKMNHHVSTFMYGVDGSALAYDRKRKTSDSAEEEMALVYQVFAANDGVILVRYEVDFSQELFPEETGARIKATTVNLVPLIDLPEGLALDQEMIVASPLDDRTLALSFRMTTDNESDMVLSRWFSALLSLETARQLRPAVELPDSTSQVVAVSSSLLAVGTVDEILLYDVAHGAVIQCVFVPDVVEDCKDWILVSDVRKGRIAIVGARDAHIYVAVSKVSLEAETQREGRLGVAAGLRSSLSSELQGRHVVALDSTKCLAHLMDEARSDESGDRMGIQVEVALMCLRVCLGAIQDPDNIGIVPYQFLVAYEKAVAGLLQVTQSSTISLGMNGMGNPQDDITKKAPISKSPNKSMRVNGAIDKQANVRVNGNKEKQITTRAITPYSLPQTFLDGATSIVLAALQLPQNEDKVVGMRVKLARLDARLILSRLIQTGKLSARFHFDSPSKLLSLDDESSDYLFRILRATKLTNKRGRRIFSPVDLMHEMLNYCPDLSERHMVTMVHYMLCRALPDDIAENLLHSGYLYPQHPYRQLAKKYFKVRSSIRKQAEGSIDGNELQHLQKDEDRLATKLLSAGASVLMRRIVQYSRCNESLLRNALASGLPTRNEPALLARVLTDMLTNRAFLPDSYRLGEREGAYSITVSVWIAALCEACREQLMSTDSEGNDNAATPMEHIRRSINEVVCHSETILSLRQKLDQVRSVRQRSTVDTGSSIIASVPTVEPSVIPPYCVERLVF